MLSSTSHELTELQAGRATLCSLVAGWVQSCMLLGGELGVVLVPRSVPRMHAYMPGSTFGLIFQNVLELPSTRNTALGPRFGGAALAQGTSPPLVPRRASCKIFSLGLGSIRDLRQQDPAGQLVIPGRKPVNNGGLLAERLCSSNEKHDLSHDCARDTVAFV